MSKQLLVGSLYNPLTDEEWDSFFSLINFSLVSKENIHAVKAMLKEAALKEPLTRKLIREHTTPFAITFTEDDLERLKDSGSRGFLLKYEMRVSWLLSHKNIPAYALHEIRHAQQEGEGYFLEGDSNESVICADKLMEAEAHAISSVYEHRNSYFDRLLKHNTYLIKKDLKDEDVPYADNLSEKEKKQARDLYIKELATKKTIGEYTALLVQQNGYQTEALVAEFGVNLLPRERKYIERWRVLYTEQALSNERSLANVQGETEKAEEEAMKQAMIKRYPELKKYDFFQTGLSNALLRKKGLSGEKTLKTGVTYFKGTNIVHTEVKIDENGQFVAHVYRNDARHSLALKSYYNHQSIRHGDEIYYDVLGNPKQIKTYKNGVLVSLADYKKEGRDGILHKYIDIYQGNRVVEKKVYRGEELFSTERLVNGENMRKTCKNHVVYHHVQPNGVKSKDVFYENGLLMSSVFYDEKGKILYRHQRKGEGYEVVYKNPNKDGLVGYSFQYDDKLGVFSVSRSYASGEVVRGHETKDGKKIGFWVKVDENLKQTPVFFTGKVKNGKPETQVPPVQILTDQGFEKDYQQDRKGFVRYFKPKGDGTRQICYLDKLGFVAAVGLTKMNEKNGLYEPVGKWNYYHLGKPVEKSVFEKNTVCVTNTPLNEPKYTSPVQKNEDDTTYFRTGELKEIETDKGTIEYDINGNLIYDSTGNRIFRYHNKKSAGKLSEQVFFTDDGSCGNISYRKDGTKGYIDFCDDEGNGWITLYGPDGKSVVAHGPEKDYNRHGRWCFKRGYGLEFIEYKDGKPVGEGERVYGSNLSVQEVHRTEIMGKDGFDENGFSDYHRAIQNKDKLGIDAYLKSGGDVSQETALGLTPVALAALTGDEKIMRYLIKNGLDIHKKNEKGVTPLQQVICCADLRAVQLLVELKVNVNEKGADGLGALDTIEKELLTAGVKRKRELEKIKTFLIQHGAKSLRQEKLADENKGVVGRFSICGEIVSDSETKDLDTNKKLRKSGALSSRR